MLHFWPTVYASNIEYEATSSKVRGDGDGSNGEGQTWKIHFCFMDSSGIRYFDILGFFFGFAPTAKIEEQVRFELRERFMSGVYLPGQVLTLRGLAGELGVSLMPVRQAVRGIPERSATRNSHRPAARPDYRLRHAHSRPRR